MKGYAKKFCVVSQHHFRRFRRRDVVTRLNLIEVLEDDGAFPNVLGQPAADHRRLIESPHNYRLRFFGWEPELVPTSRLLWRGPRRTSWPRRLSHRKT